MESSTQSSSSYRSKYEVVKLITLAEIYNAREGLSDAGCFHREFNRLIALRQEQYGRVYFWSEITDILEWIEKEPEWAKWGIEKGFLREIKQPEPERIFYSGQKFRRNHDTNTYVLEYDHARRVMNLVTQGLHGSWDVSNNAYRDSPRLEESRFRRVLGSGGLKDLEPVDR